MKLTYNHSEFIIAVLLEEDKLIAIRSASIKDQIPDLHDLLPSPFSTTNKIIQLEGTVHYYEFSCPQIDGDSNEEFLRINWEKGTQEFSDPTIELLGCPDVFDIY